jgi:lipopolysaccharide export system permease protein
MFKIYYKSAFKELSLTFLLSLAFLNSVLMMEKIIRMSRTISGVGASLYDMGTIILFIQPQLFILTIPMSLLLSILLVYGRMNLDNELVVLRTCGMDFRRISLPALALGIVCFFIAISVSFYIGPRSSIELRDKITKIIASRSIHAIDEGTFITSFKDVVIMVKGKKPPDRLEQIFMYDDRIKNEPKVLMAKEGYLFGREGFKVVLYLKDGNINITRDKDITEIFFESYKMNLDFTAAAPSPKKREMTPFELLREIQKANGENDRAPLYLEFYRRLSLPVVCLILIFLGPPLSLIAGKSGRLGGLALGLLVFTSYYMLLIYFENLVRAGKLSHYTGAWIPTALLGLFAFLMFRKENYR